MKKVKRFSTTTITVEKSMTDIVKVLKKYGILTHQFTTFPKRIDFRFMLDTKPYLFSIPMSDTNEKENRRMMRVLHWYIDGILAADESGLFTPARLLLPFREIPAETPSTIADAFEDGELYQKIRVALGNKELALESGDQK